MHFSLLSRTVDRVIKIILKEKKNKIDININLGGKSKKKKYTHKNNTIADHNK